MNVVLVIMNECAVYWICKLFLLSQIEILEGSIPWDGRRREGKQTATFFSPVVADVHFPCLPHHDSGIGGHLRGHPACVLCYCLWATNRYHHFNHSRSLPFRNIYCFLASAYSLEILGKEPGKNCECSAWNQWAGIVSSLWVTPLLLKEWTDWHQARRTAHPLGLIPLFISRNLKDNKLETLPVSLSQDLIWCHSSHVSLASESTRTQISPGPN